MKRGNQRKPWQKAPTLSRVDRKLEAEEALAAFLANGGAVKQMPSVVPTIFACANCGHAGTMGVASGKVRRCPKCREILPD